MFDAVAFLTDKSFPIGSISVKIFVQIPYLELHLKNLVL